METRQSQTGERQERQGTHVLARQRNTEYIPVQQYNGN